MANTKIIIEIKGGNIQNISSTCEVDVCIVDYDLLDDGEEPINGILAQDVLFESGKAHELYTDANDPQEMEIKDLLKALKF